MDQSGCKWVKVGANGQKWMKISAVLHLSLLYLCCRIAFIFLTVCHVDYFTFLFFVFFTFRLLSLLPSHFWQKILLRSHLRTESEFWPDVWRHHFVDQINPCFFKLLSRQQQLQVFGRSGANGRSATPPAPAPVARSSGLATATLSRLMPVMATQLRRLRAHQSPPIKQLARMLPIQVTCRTLDRVTNLNTICFGWDVGGG